MRTLKEYTNPKFKKFVKDMKKAGLEPYHYRGRFFYEGPAVTVSDIADAMSVTKVKCQWDNMALQYVVYPQE